MKVIDWIDGEEADSKRESVGWLGGWFEKGHRWDDYIELFHEESRPYIEAIRQSVIENKMRTTGEEHQYSAVPLFEDDTVGMFSFRAWGDLMAAIWSTEEDKDYHYMDFYM